MLTCDTCDCFDPLQGVVRPPLNIIIISTLEQMLTQRLITACIASMSDEGPTRKPNTRSCNISRVQLLHGQQHLELAF